jgi:hypothetical protein
MNRDDAYMDFIEAVCDQLGRSTECFKAGASLRAAKALEHAVELCERYPSFAFGAHETLGPMRIVVEASIASVIRRIDVGEEMATLLLRMQALEQPGLH